MRHQPGSIDPAPLLAMLGDLDNFAAADLLGVSARTLDRWRVGRYRIDSVWAADAAACAIGLHPMQIWPDYEDWPWPDAQLTLGEEDVA